MPGGFTLANTIRQIAIPPVSCTTFAKSCPQLQCLRIQDCMLPKSPPSVPNLLFLFLNLREVIVHPSTFQLNGYLYLLDFVSLDPNPDRTGPQPQQQPDHRPQLKHLDLVGDISQR